MYRMCLKIVLAVGVLSIALHADTVSLQNDFSITNGNPNGNWSYSEGMTPSTATLLTFQMPLNNNALYPALSTGYWGTGSDLNVNTPFLFKALVDGSNAGETNNDFLAGNIVGHSPNAGDYLFETWTAPSAGTVGTLSGMVWYAHSVVSRSNDWSLLFDNSTLTSGTVTNGQGLSNPDIFSSGGFSVQAGDTISLAIRKSAGQQFGSLAGMDLDFAFTPTPEPGSLILLGSGIVGLAGLLRRKLSL